jgi:hypothetical protein
MQEIIKILGAGYVSVLAFIFAFLFSIALDKLTGPYDKSKSKARVFLEIALQFALVGVILYITRGLIKKIPFPLEGVHGYTHSSLGELRSLPLFVFIFMFFQKNLQTKMNALLN